MLTLKSVIYPVSKITSYRNRVTKESYLHYPCHHLELYVHILKKLKNQHITFDTFYVTNNFFSNDNIINLRLYNLKKYR